MELEKSYENICINKTVFNGSVEQGVEIDYLLPDYCKSIFKILKSTITPKITSIRVSGDKLNIDATAIAKIIYISEESSQICSVEQKQPFSKTIDIGLECESYEVIPTIKTDYVNCRVVNNKRLDLRGAISINIQVVNQVCEEAISNASGLGIQLNRKTITVGDKSCIGTKQFSVTQTIDMPYGKPMLDNTILHNACAYITEYKIIANKVITKGEIAVHILYMPVDSDDNSCPETMEITIPISQIIDVDGVNEEHKCVIALDVCSVEISTSEEPNSIDLEFIINANCTAYKNKTIDILTDVYSTKHPHSIDSTEIEASCYIDNISEQGVIKSSLEINSDELDRIIDCCSEIKNYTTTCSNGEVVISGNLEIYALYLTSDNMPQIVERLLPFEHKLKHSACSDSCIAKLTIFPTLTTFNISESKLEVNTEIKNIGCIISKAEAKAVTNISLNTETEKTTKSSAVLTLYFAEENEKVWDIAKSYNTNVSAVINENELETDVIPQKTMLLIPITE